jgi:hypothetical protein
LYIDACIPLSLVFEQYPQYLKCKKLGNDIQRMKIQSFLVNPVISDIKHVFDNTVNTARDVIRRLMLHLPTVVGAVPRQVLEAIILKKEYLPIIEEFFENEYHNAKDQLTKDRITSIESWVIQKWDGHLATDEETKLIAFLLELNKEQIEYYAKWDDRRIEVENRLLCQIDSTDYRPEDLAKVNSLELSGKILDRDRQTLATLYRIKQENSFGIVYASTDYSIVLAKSTIEVNLGFAVSDPLYALRKLVGY